MDPVPGQLIAVAYAGDPIQAELIQGLLENAGIRSLRRAAGVNGPPRGFPSVEAGFGHQGQKVLVRASQAERAREVLAETLVEDEGADWSEIANAKHLEGGGRRSRDYGPAGAYARIYLWSLLGFAAVFGVFLLLRAI
ncbi:MAG TPA: DUF2007 domain-containing protein [Solirubrobacterales bacterium]